MARPQNIWTRNPSGPADDARAVATLVKRRVMGASGSITAARQSRR